MLHQHSPRTAIAVLASAALIAGCSFGGDDPPLEGLVAGDVEPADIPQFASATVSAGPVWGNGQAVDAHVLPDGSTAIVTTTGVFTVEAVDTPPTRIASFETSTQFGPSALSADGATLALTTQNPPAIRWNDLAAGSVIAGTDLDVGTQLLSVDFQPDGSLVAATSAGIAIWGPAGAPSPSPFGEPVGAIAGLADGRLLAPVLDTDEIAIVDGAEVTRSDVGLPDGVPVEQIKSSADGSIVVAAYNAGEDAFEPSTSLVVLDPATLAPTATIDVGPDLDPAAWTITDTAIVAATDTSLRAWSPDGSEIGSTPNADEQPIDLLLDDGELVVAVQRGGSIATWSPTADAPTRLAEGVATIRQARVSDGTLVTVDFFGVIDRYALGDRTVTSEPRFGYGAVTAVAHSLDSDSVAIATEIGRAFVLAPDLAQQSTVNAGDRKRIDTVALQPSTDRVVTGLAERVGAVAFDDTLAIWSPGSPEPVFRYGGESEDVAGCAFFYNRIDFSVDGELMSSTSHDFTVTVHTAATGEAVHTFPAMPSTVLATDFGPDGDVIVAAADDATVTVWDVIELTEIASYRAVPGGFQSLAALPDDTMVTSDLTGRIAIVDMLTGAEVRPIADTGARSPVLDVTPDGGLVAAALPDGAVGIWSTTSGRQLASLTGHTGEVVTISFAPDGSSLITGSSDGTARSWTIEAVST